MNSFLLKKIAKTVKLGHNRIQERLAPEHSKKRMDDATAAHVFQVAVKVAKAMKETLGCEGLNIVQNNGEIAGQTVFHFHMHIIPRYKGDTVNIGWTPGKADADEINELKEKIAAGL